MEAQVYLSVMLKHHCTDARPFQLMVCVKDHIDKDIHSTRGRTEAAGSPKLHRGHEQDDGPFDFTTEA